MSKLTHFSLAADNKFNKGVGIIEVLIATAIVSVVLVSFMGLFNNYLKTSQNNKKNIQALNLAQGAMEAARVIRDDSWNNISSPNITMGADYYPKIVENKWQLESGKESGSVFTRWVVFAVVRRDGGNIVESGGSEDPDTRKVTVIVEWSGQEIKLITYLTNWGI